MGGGMLQDHWVYVGALFAALGQSTLALTLTIRVLKDMIRDKHPWYCGISAYRTTILLAGLFIFVRATPTALIIMFDPPYPLTNSLKTQYIAVMFGLPIAIMFAFLVEAAKKPLTRKLREPGVELSRPIWPEIRNEVVIVLVCLVLAFLIVMSRV
jgi:hypothetical protein